MVLQKEHNIWRVFLQICVPENLAQRSRKFGVNIYNNAPETLPENEEELQLHMQLDYKQAIEIAEEASN